MNILTGIPSASSVYTEIFSFCENEIRAKQKVGNPPLCLLWSHWCPGPLLICGTPKSWDSEKYPSDIASWLLKAVHDKDASAAPTSEAIDYDSRLILLAGRCVARPLSRR